MYGLIEPILHEHRLTLANHFFHKHRNFFSNAPSHTIMPRAMRTVLILMTGGKVRTATYPTPDSDAIISDIVSVFFEVKIACMIFLVLITKGCLTVYTVTIVMKLSIVSNVRTVVNQLFVMIVVDARTVYFVSTYAINNIASVINSLLGNNLRSKKNNLIFRHVLDTSVVRIFFKK